MKRIPLAKIIELYVHRRLSARQVADCFGVSRQVIISRLIAAGIKTRKAGPGPIAFTKEELEDLYVERRFSVNRIAETLNTTPARIIRAMDRYGMERRKRRGRPTKHPELRKLKIGESLDLPKVEWLKPHTQFYSMAECAGIRVSTRSIDHRTIRVTRKA